MSEQSNTNANPTYDELLEAHQKRPAALEKYAAG